MTESTTPRTDAEFRDYGYTWTRSRDGHDTECDMVPVEFAQRLERALADRGVDIDRLARIGADQSAEIRRLEGALSEGSAKWIPVGERLPATTRLYLAASSTGDVETLYYITGAGWRDDGPSDGYWDRFVTHWMPLPEAPK